MVQYFNRYPLTKYTRMSGILISLMLIFLLTVPACTDTQDPTELKDDRDAYIGTWNVSESCSKDAYTVQIVKDPSNSSQVLIQNFWHILNCTDPPYAIIAGTNIVMPQQSICGDSFVVDGSGKLDKDKITMNYTVNDGADLHSCSAVYEKP